MSDFVNFKLAQKLKEKGFREECLCHYVGEDLYYNIESPIANNQLWFSHNKFDNIWHRDNHDAPTISQALKWLREKHATHIEVSLGRNGWYFEIIQYEYYEEEKEYGCKLITISVINDSYEQAALAGVNYCLENLI